MCGIAGMIGAGAAQQVQARVEQMTSTLEHRGPDGAGIFTARVANSDLSLALGHRRLAILDLSPAGRQPMSTPDGRWTLVFNGEIFNYLELRSQLGLPLRSTTDTEVLLECCAAWGVAATLERAVGMFAFALWDSLQSELTLARDRVGEKPLVYFWDRSTLAFASEMKALAPLHGGRLNAPAVDVYLALGYVPAPLGVFRNTAKLPAGSLARWKRGRLDVERWWFPEHAQPQSTAGPRTGQLRELLADAVRLRLRSDVPVALALSGGLDSSVIAAELAHQGVKPDAFTVTFDEDETDLPYARQVAARHHLPLEVIRAGARGVAQEFTAAAGHYDEPFADSSGLASLALARALKGRYKVILNGDGGDEAFGGYRHYEYVGPKQLLKAAAAAVGFRDGWGAMDVYVQSKTTFRRQERAGLVGSHGGDGDSLTALLAADEFLRVARAGALKQALWSDRHLYLANDLTYKMDIALGACGIEGRAPFLDHRVLEWAQHLDASELVRGREKKILLRQAYQDQLPPEVASRAKHGFGSPIAQWLAAPLAPLVRAALPCPLLAGDAQAGATGQRLWTLLTFAEWSRTWSASW